MTWLSAFLMNPALALGAGAVASPILIHLLSRRRHHRVRWAAMDFLLEAQRRNRRRIKIEQMILLALRCLAVLLLALMMARPFLRAGAAASLVGGPSRTERVILLDDSYSMGYRDADGQSVFQHGVQTVKQLARWLAAESPGDTFTLRLTSRTGAPLVSLPGLSEERVRGLDDRLDVLSPSQDVARFPDAMSAIARSIRDSAAQANVAIYVLSDFQRSDWHKSPSGDLGAAVAPLAELGAARARPRIVFIDLAVDAPHNSAITSVSSVQPQIVTGVPTYFDIGVCNYSTASIDHVELSLALSRQPLPPVVLARIPPGQTVHERVEITFPEAGADGLTVHMSGAAAAADPLALDNARSVGVEVLPAVQVLAVDGEPGADSLRDEVFLLGTALHPAGHAASGIEVTVVTEQEIDAVEWSRYHVVILANVPRLSTTSKKSIAQFIDSGGGVAVFAGDLVDAKYYNSEFHEEGRGWLPAKLGEPQHAPARTDALHIADWDSGHPLMRSFSGPLAAVLTQVRVSQFISATPDPEAATAPAASQPAPASVLARFDDAQRSPAILCKSFGRGKAVLITTSADQEWNDWASSFSYVPFMLELVQFIARRSDVDGQSLVGRPLTFPLNPLIFRPHARLRSPAYPADPEIPLEAHASDSATDSRPSLGYTEASKVGLWSFELSTVTGAPERQLVGVNPDPTESDLARATRSDLDGCMGSLKYEYVRDLNSFTRDSADARTEIWWPLLWAAIAILMSEHGLAWYFGTRGR